MSLKENLGLLYYIFPFISKAQNKISLISSILLGRNLHTIILNNGSKVTFKNLQFDTMLAFLAIITYAYGYSVNNRIIELDFGPKSKFKIPLDNIDFENSNLIQILFAGLRHGANFVTNDEDFKIKRDKTIKITELNGKKILETSEGINFYLDSIHGANTTITPFIQKIHVIDSTYDWKDKIVVDVGAECGDTPLFYAYLGAKVFAVEPVKAHYEAMLRNLSLNPDIAKRIIPINAAVGKDGMLTFYQNTREEIAEMASYVYNVHGKNVTTSQVQGYSFENLLKKYEIKHVDLFKIDCKGCEFALTEDALKNVDMVKISNTYDKDPERNQRKLLSLLENAGFRCIPYRINPNRDTHSLGETAHILGIKIKNN